MSNTSSPFLDIVREAARSEVDLSSLRAVASTMEISHTSLAGFIRADNPSEPYGIGRRRLLMWGIQRGIIPAEAWEGAGWRKIGDLAQSVVRETVAPRREHSTEELARVRQHLRRLLGSGLGEARLIAAEQLMREDPFSSIRGDQPREIPLEDRLANIDRSYRYIAEVLQHEGYDIPLDPDAPLEESVQSDPDADATPRPRTPPSPTIDEVEESAAVLEQLPPPSKAKATKSGKTRKRA